MTYPETLEWLFAQTRGAPRDPNRMRLLMTALDLQAPPKSVHVVGSNGKGSTAAMLAAGLRAMGERAGLFVSPHLEEFRERISVDGEPIGTEAVAATLARWRGAPLPLRPGFFEWALALALEHFAREGVTAAVIEAGIGAARDATLAVEPVVLAVLTSVALEHQAILGDSLAAIAQDKAAALRPGVPAVTAAEGEALAVVRQVAALRGSPLYADDGQTPLFSLPEAFAPLSRENPSRYRNARLAAAGLRLLGADEAAVARAVASPPLPGRREPFALRGRTVLLDGAHNPAACAALAATLAPGFTLLFGALGRKQGEASLRALEPLARAVFVTDVASEPSALAGPGRVHLNEPEAALLAALEATPAGGTLLITGSFYLAGALRPRLRALQQQAPPQRVA